MARLRGGTPLAQTTVSIPAPRAEVRTALDWVTPTLALIFIVSGASGLIYQIAWVRLLSLTFGVTIYAVSTVVAAFMGGLALGSFMGGRIADRVRRPILWYAGVEVCIAALGLFSPTALAWVQATYVALHPVDAAEASLGIVALRFGLASLVVFIPATLMGATLPLIIKGSLALGRDIGPRVSWLYAANTTGAILGTLGAGFLLIGALGITSTISAAAALNVTAALGAVGVTAILRPAAGSAATIESAAAERQTRDGSVQTGTMVRVLVIATFAVQGLVSLAYEVIWFRVVAVILDGSTYAFSIVLATVLLGIALGSALVGPLMSRTLPWIKVYALLQASVAAMGLLGIIVFARIYGIIAHLEAIPFIGALTQSHFAWMALVAMIPMLPPMVLLGASFPIAARITVANTNNAGRDLGLLYCGNTTGAILGSWAAGFFLIPALGTQLSLQILAVFNAALAIGLALVSGPRRFVIVAVCAAMILGSAAAVATLAGNMYRHMVLSRFSGNDIVWIGEGKEVSVAVMERRADGVKNMYLNGQHQGGDDAGMVAFHRLLGHIPMVLHPNPQDILIVGLGGGTTAGALSRHNPARMDVVELSETVVEGARRFNHVNANILEFPNLRLKIDDGRNHLLLTDHKYDIITADVIHPRNAGSAVLYSEEYYRLARAALKPGGIMAQWLEDNGENPDNELQRRVMARTFLKVFPHVTLWAFGALMIGSNEPIDFDRATLVQRWDRRDLPRILADSGFDRPEAFLSLYRLPDSELRAWAGEGPVMTDNRPYIEFFLSLPGRAFLPRFMRGGE